MLEKNEILIILDEFSKISKNKGYKPQTHIDNKLGSGGFFNVNDKYCVKIHIFPYPQMITIDLIEKYESFIIDGKEVESYKLKELSNYSIFIENVLNTINERINNER